MEQILLIKHCRHGTIKLGLNVFFFKITVYIVYSLKQFLSDLGFFCMALSCFISMHKLAGNEAGLRNLFLYLKTFFHFGYCAGLVFCLACAYHSPQMMDFPISLSHPSCWKSMQWSVSFLLVFLEDSCFHASGIFIFDTFLSKERKSGRRKTTVLPSFLLFGLEEES